MQKKINLQYSFHGSQILKVIERLSKTLFLPDAKYRKRKMAMKLNLMSLLGIYQAAQV